MKTLIILIKKKMNTMNIDKNNIAICLTAGEQSENHVGMQKIGNGLADKGFSVDELLEFKEKLQTMQVSSEFYRLDKMADIEEEEEDMQLEPAGLLIIRNGIKQLLDIDPDLMLREQLAFDWDTKYWDTRRSKVLNKRARWNVCYSDVAQSPDYQQKKGTIIPYDAVPHLANWRFLLQKLFTQQKNFTLQVEGNLYYDSNKCGIGFHGDSERKIVIACSLGAKRPIHWQWFLRSKSIGKRIMFSIQHGDMYIMSQKTTGFDWKKRSSPTLRHAAGRKYV